MQDRRARVGSDLTLLVLTLALLIAMALPGVAGAVRPLLALGACALLPGAALLTRFPVDSLLSWVLASILISLAIETIVSLVMLWSGWWRPLEVAAVLAVLSSLLLLLDLISALRGARVTDRGREATPRDATTPASDATRAAH